MLQPEALPMHYLDLFCFTYAVQMEVRVAEIHHGVSKITQFQNIWIQHEAEMNWMKLPPCFAALIVSNEL